MRQTHALTLCVLAGLAAIAWAGNTHYYKPDLQHRANRGPRRVQACTFLLPILYVQKEQARSCYAVPAAALETELDHEKLLRHVSFQEKESYDREKLVY